MYSMRQRRRIALVLRQQLHDHPVLVERRVDGRDLALSVSVVEAFSICSGVTPSAEALSRSIFTIDLRARDLQVAGDVQQSGMARICFSNAGAAW